MRTPTHAFAFRQRGAELIEFALVALYAAVLLGGVIQVGWMLAAWNTAAEATRWGARIAVVCDVDAETVKTKMQALFPVLKAPDTDIQVTYPAAGCNVGSCQVVTVRIQPSAGVLSFVPFLPGPIALPAFTTTLPRESLQSTFNGVANPVCQ